MLTSNDVLSKLLLAARRRLEKERPSSNPPADKGVSQMASIGPVPAALNVDRIPKTYKGIEMLR